MRIVWVRPRKRSETSALETNPRLRPSFRQPCFGSSWYVSLGQIWENLPIMDRKGSKIGLGILGSNQWKAEICHQNLNYGYTIGNSRITFHHFSFRELFLVIVSSWLTSKNLAELFLVICRICISWLTSDNIRNHYIRKFWGNCFS